MSVPRSLSGLLCLALLLVLSAADWSAARDWRLTPSLTVSERYDDNIRLVAAKRETDAVTSATPGLSLDYETRDLRLDAGYSLSFERYARHPDLNNFAHSATLDVGLKRLFGRETTSLSFSEAFLFSPAASAFQEVGTVQTPRGDAVTNTAQLTLTHQFTHRLTQQVVYRNELNLYKLPTLSDSAVHEGRLETMYWLDSTDSITGLYRVRYFDFLDSGAAQNALSHAFLARFKHLFGPTVSMTSFLGINLSAQPIHPASWTQTLIGGVGFSKTEGRLEVTADYIRDVALVSGLSSELVTTQTVSALVAYGLTRDLRASVTGGLSDNQSLVGHQVQVTSWTAGGALGYQLLDWLSAEIRYIHFKQQTKFEVGNNLRRNQYLFTLTALFPERKRNVEIRPDEPGQPEMSE